jgi:hypothetical protein
MEQVQKTGWLYYGRLDLSGCEKWKYEPFKKVEEEIPDLINSFTWAPEQGAILPPNLAVGHPVQTQAAAGPVWPVQHPHHHYHPHPPPAVAHQQPNHYFQGQHPLGYNFYNNHNYQLPVHGQPVHAPLPQHAGAPWQQQAAIPQAPTTWIISGLLSFCVRLNEFELLH